MKKELPASGSFFILLQRLNEGHKKTLPKGRGRSKRLALVQNTSHAGLLAVGGVLGDDALRGGLVNSGGGSNQSLNRSVGVELLQSGLGGRLNHLVAQGLVLSNGNALDSGLDIRHRNFPP